MKRVSSIESYPIFVSLQTAAFRLQPRLVCLALRNSRSPACFLPSINLRYPSLHSSVIVCCFVITLSSLLFRLWVCFPFPFPFFSFFSAVRAPIGAPDLSVALLPTASSFVHIYSYLAPHVILVALQNSNMHSYCFGIVRISPPRIISYL